MARPKSRYLDLAPHMTARQLKKGAVLYYYTAGGKKTPLGSDKSAAIVLAEKMNAGEESTLHTLLCEREIIARATYLKRTCGVYFLIKDESVIYVGQTLDVEKRIREHFAEGDGKDFDRYAFIPCKPQQRKLLEAAYIRILQPELNRAFPRLGESLKKLSARKTINLGNNY